MCADSSPLAFGSFTKITDTVLVSISFLFILSFLCVSLCFVCSSLVNCRASTIGAAGRGTLAQFRWRRKTNREKKTRQRMHALPYIVNEVNSAENGITYFFRIIDAINFHFKANKFQLQHSGVCVFA
jgi:ABC-type transport system involved in multi-copper enzyme maturation permease subunit